MSITTKTTSLGNGSLPVLLRKPAAYIFAIVEREASTLMKWR